MVLKKLIQWALDNAGWTVGFFLIITLFAAYHLPTLPVDAVPDITNVQVVINSKTGALDPEKIESFVTRPVETEMTGIPHLEEVRSISKYGLSQVTLIFTDGTDLTWCRQQVSERLANLRKSLPESVSAELAPPTTGLGEVLMYSVEAVPGSDMDRLPEKKKLIELRTIQDYMIRPQLKRISGIAEVDSNGGYQKEIHINFYPNRLENLGISIDQLTSKIETLGENFGGGYIQRDQQQIIVRTTPGFQNLQELKKLPLGLDVRGKPILLSQVADVREDHAQRLGAATRNGKETVLGTVLMRMGANSRQVAQDTEKKIQELTLPEGVQVSLLYSRSFLVNATIQTVIKNLAEGAILVVVVLLILLGQLRAGLVVALAIPISMLLATQGMLWAGVSANLMSLGAIDFGLIVDGSVVMIEHILKVLHHETALQKRKLTREEKKQAVLAGAHEVVGPVVFGVLMIMLVYIPVLTLEGVEGKMFKPMAFTVMTALGVSLFLAVFLMPVLAHWMIPTPSPEDESETRIIRWIQKLYTPLINLSFQHTGKFFIAASALVIFGFSLALRMGTDFIPKLNEGDLVFNLTRDSRQSLSQSIEDQKRADEVLKKIPGVQEVFSRMGTPESATDPMGVYLSDTFLILSRESQDITPESRENRIQLIQKQLKEILPEQEIAQTQPIEMRFNEMLEGSRADVTLRILGNSLPDLMATSDKIQENLQSIAGIDSIDSDPLTALRKGPMLDLVPDFNKLASHGISVSEINRLVELAMGGRAVGSFLEQDKKFPIVIHLDESLRDSPTAIQQIPVTLPQGGTLPISQVTRTELKDQVTTIARWWGERYAALSIYLKGRDVGSFVQEAQARIQQSIQLKEGQKLYWGGQFKNLDRARKKLWAVVPLTLVIVFVILLRMLGSFTQAVLIFASIPFATVGGILTLALRGMPLSISAAIGFIALMGIALLNSIVLVNFFKQEILKSPSPGNPMDLMTIIKSGALSRLRPILMTAMVASLGFIPMAFNTGLGSEVQRPLATVVIGGLVTSTLLTLLLLPSWYLWISQKINK